MIVPANPHRGSEFPIGAKEVSCGIADLDDFGMCNFTVTLEESKDFFFKILIF